MGTPQMFEHYNDSHFDEIKHLILDLTKDKQQKVEFFMQSREFVKIESVVGKRLSVQIFRLVLEISQREGGRISESKSTAELSLNDQQTQQKKSRRSRRKKNKKINGNDETTITITDLEATDVALQETSKVSSVEEEAIIEDFSI